MSKILKRMSGFRDIGF